MRLIGFGLLAFLLVGIAILLGNSSSLRLGIRTLSEVALGPRLFFETANPADTVSSHIAVVRRAGPSTPIILTGLPAYQSTFFFMPIDARPISGQLQIDATIQALAGVEGALRISIGNTKRAELLLRPGEAKRSISIELTEEDVSQERIDVSFSLQGEGSTAPCGVDAGIEAIVEIETTSSVTLALDRPITTDRDQTLINGKRLSIAWDARTEVATLLAGRNVLNAGIDLQFNSEGLLSSNALEVAEDLGHDKKARPFAWSKATSPWGSLFGLRQFHRKHTWRIRYDMTDGFDKRLPSHLMLDMVLGQQLGGARWHIATTLNGRHLSDDYVEGGAYSIRLPLAARDHQRANVIDISATSFWEAQDRCARGPELVAEVVGTTHFQVGQQTFEDPLAHIVASLSDGWSLSNSSLTPAEAIVAANLLALLPPPEGSVASKSKVQVLRRGTDLKKWKDQNSNFWIAHFVDGALLAVEAKDYDARTLQEVSLLFDLNETGS